jgi:hypothetical protein
MNARNERLGRVSVGAALAGVAFPVLVFLVAFAEAGTRFPLAVVGVAYWGGMACEAAAFAAGAVAFRTRPGKIGLVVSGLLLGLGACLYLAFYLIIVPLRGIPH